ncbi:hypothetical protein MMC22_004758 [Lobaria immixta]|nr:hypothetical protein [Lobaria immixta]
MPPKSIKIEAREKIVQKITDEARWAEIPCQNCMKAGVECKVGRSSGRCARCAGQGLTIAKCGVDKSRFLLSRPTGAGLPSAGTDNLPSVGGSAVPAAAAAVGDFLTVGGNVLSVHSPPAREGLVLLEQRIASIETMLAQQREALRWMANVIHLQTGIPMPEFFSAAGVPPLSPARSSPASAVRG